MESQEINILIQLAGICLIHQVIFAIILLIKKSNSRANHVLAVFMLIFGGVHLDDMLIFSGLAWKYHFVNETVHFLFFFLGPLYLLYTSYMTGIPVNWRKRRWLHILSFIPAAMYVVYMSLLPEHDVKNFYAGMTVRPPVLNSLLNFFTGLQMGIYLIWSLKLVYQYNRRIRSKSYYPDLNLRWLATLTIWLLLICYLIAPALLVWADSDTTVFYAFQPVMTTVIYLFLLYRSIKFPGQEYEQQLIIREEREKVHRDIHDEIAHELNRITLLAEAAKKEVGNTAQFMTDISAQSEKLSVRMRKFLTTLTGNK